MAAQRTGSVVCPECGRLVGVSEKRCPFCGRAAPGMFGFGPLLRKLSGEAEMGLGMLITSGCVVLYLATLAVDMGGIGNHGLMGFLSPSPGSLLAFGASGAYPVFEFGRWWTVLSAGWLHGNLLHILFNMMWVRQLAPAMVHLYGPGRTVVIYTLSSVAGFAASTLSIFLPGWVRQITGGGGTSVGASAALFGLLGALIHYSRRGGSRALGQQVWSWAIPLFVIGLIPGFNVDNWAHLGGFAGGWLLSYWLDPMRQERLDHLVAGGVCLLATAAAVAWSLITAFRPL